MIGVKNMYISKYQYQNLVAGTIIPNINKNIQRDFTKKNEISFESKRQAFKKASNLLFFNPDMQYFVTLTYRKQHKNYSMVLDDLKNFSRSQKIFKYVGVVEKHKSGNLHIHLITNKIKTVSHRVGCQSALAWKKGFSDVRAISDFDEQFNIFKYLFKYLQKSEKIGGRWVLKSRNLNKPTVIHYEKDLKGTIQYLEFLERNNFTIDKKLIKDYLFNEHIIFNFNNKKICR